MIIRPDNFTKIIKQYKCASRSNSSNSRFNDHITKEDVCEVLFKYDFKCFYCNKRIDEKTWQLDHFHPRANGGLNAIHNLVCTCRWCNTMKNALDGHAFINKCNEVISNNFFIRNNIEYNTENKEVNSRTRKIKRKMDKLNMDYDDEFISFIKESIIILNNKK